jgi:hypothetical protein
MCSTEEKYQNSRISNWKLHPDILETLYFISGRHYCSFPKKKERKLSLKLREVPQEANSITLCTSENPDTEFSNTGNCEKS